MPCDRRLDEEIQFCVFYTVKSAHVRHCRHCISLYVYTNITLAITRTTQKCYFRLWWYFLFYYARKTFASYVNVNYVGCLGSTETQLSLFLEESERVFHKHEQKLLGLYRRTATAVCQRDKLGLCDFSD